MKAILNSLILLVSLAQAAHGQTNFFPFLFCHDRIYTNATISSVTPATVTILWDGGGEQIAITNLPPELLAQYRYNHQQRGHKGVS